MLWWLGGTPGVQDASCVSLWATCLPSLLGDLVPSCRPWLITARVVTSPFPSTTVLLQILFFVCPDSSCHLCNIGSDLPLLQWLKLNKAAEKPLQELLWTAPAMTSAWVNGQSPTLASVHLQRGTREVFQTLLIYIIPFIFSRTNMTVSAGCQGCSGPKIKNNCTHCPLPCSASRHLGPPQQLWGLAPISVTSGWYKGRQCWAKCYIKLQDTCPHPLGSSSPMDKQSQIILVSILIFNWSLITALLIGVPSSYRQGAGVHVCAVPNTTLRRDRALSGQMLCVLHSAPPLPTVGVQLVWK